MENINMILVMSLLLIVLYIVITVMRAVVFSTTPVFSEEFESSKFMSVKLMKIKSPVQGTVVYFFKKLGKDLFINKNDRQLLISRYLNLNDNDTFFHLGIFMTVYDNHHVISFIENEPIEVTRIGEVNHIPMMNYLSSLLSVFGIKFKNWEEKTFSFMRNQQYILRLINRPDFYVIITMDKYVNKLDLFGASKISENKWFIPPMYTRKILGFISKGSQCDFIIKDTKNIFPIFDEQFVGSRVNFNSTLFTLRD